MSLIQSFKLGDRVAVLHETIKGEITKINGQQITIQDEDGFSRTYESETIVKQETKSSYRIEENLAIKDLSESKGPKIFKAPITQNPEIDLHIEELTDDYHHLGNYEIVQIQMTACRSFVRESINHNRKKIVIIHGKGTGVLKSEIRHYLNRISSNEGVELIYHDASYREYGQGGATEVVFNP